MKQLIYIILLFCGLGCHKNENCEAVFFNSDTSVCYEGDPYKINKLCVQDIKIKGKAEEYGENYFIKDTILVFKDSQLIYFSKKAIDPFKDKRILIDYGSSEAKQNSFYDPIIKDTFYRVGYDALLKGIEDANIYIYFVIGKKSGIKGVYIHDKSDHILKKYSKSVVRSINGSIYPNLLDTANTIIYTGTPKGVFN